MGYRRPVLTPRCRLARFFGTSWRFWINLQSRYHQSGLRDALEEICPTAAARDGLKSISHDQISRRSARPAS
jgi:plasmid maintenance system antidote protein VapI